MGSVAAGTAPGIGGQIIKTVAVAGGGLGFAEMVTEIIEALIKGDKAIAAAEITANSELEKKKLEHKNELERMNIQHQLDLEIAEIEAERMDALEAKQKNAVVNDTLAIVPKPWVTIEELPDTEEEIVITRPFMPFTYWEMAGGVLILLMIVTIVLSVVVGMIICLKKVLCGDSEKEEYLV